MNAIEIIINLYTIFIISNIFTLNEFDRKTYKFIYYIIIRLRIQKRNRCKLEFRKCLHLTSMLIIGGISCSVNNIVALTCFK